MKISNHWQRETFSGKLGKGKLMPQRFQGVVNLCRLSAIWDYIGPTQSTLSSFSGFSVTSQPPKPLRNEHPAS